MNIRPPRTGQTGVRIWALLAALGVAALLPTTAAGRTSIRQLPRSDSGIQVELVFDYEVPDGFQFSGVGAIWSATRPVPGVYTTMYLPYDRDRDNDKSRAWWRAHHPSWVEYQCDRHRWATEFGDPAAPLDISNPAVRQWQWSHEILPEIRLGYEGVAFDNLNLDNEHGRCGHYTRKHVWVPQFQGPAGLRAYQNAVIGWARFMRAKLHSIGRTIAFNFPYEEDVSRSVNERLAAVPDLLFDEAGVTNYGNPVGSPITEAHWKDIFYTARAVEARGGCYHLNGEEPQPTDLIPLTEREWIIGNYLLFRGRCTYVYITGYRPYVATDHTPPLPGLDQDYGIYHMFPEYQLPIGSPTAPPRHTGSLWLRHYTGGLVLVNPGDQRQFFAGAGRPLYALGRKASATSFTVPGHSALILLHQPAL